MADQSLETHVKTLEKSISKTGHFTLNDAASITGIAMEDTRKALDLLMAKYQTRLQLTDEGVLIYNFGKKPRRRGAKTFAERWDQIKTQLWNTFKFIFKIWIAATLVIYFVLFLIILIGVLVAMMSGGKDNKRGNNGAGKMIEMVVRMFFHIFRWNTASGTIIHDRDRKGYPYPEHDKYDSEFNKVTESQRKSFIGSIYDFAFGPPRIEVQDLSNQKEVAAYLRRKNGVIVLPEMKALAGWNSEQAEHFFTDVVVRFNGEAKISNNDVLFGEFDDLLKSVDQKTDAQIEWFWDEYEPEYKVTGNSKTRDFTIVGLNIFNLFGSLFLLNYISSETLPIDLPTGFLPELILGWFPLIFSFLFILLPGIRYFKTRKLNKEREIQNVRKRLMDIVYNKYKNEISSTELVEAANKRSKGEEALSKTEVEKVMNRFIADWDGEVIATEQGEVVYLFPRLKEELKEAENLRTLKLGGGNLGKVIISSET